jgi:superfamily II DNA helicase RecQ
VRHFGDTTDSLTACGICDFCAPDKCVAQRFRAATEMEQALAREVLESITMTGRSIGQLHTQLCSKNGMDRDSFEELMGAMARAGLVRLVESVFEKDGRQIPFRKASLTRDGGDVDEDTPIELSIRGAAAVSKHSKSGRKAGKAAAKKSKGKRVVAGKAQRPSRVESVEESRASVLLKEWRRTQAKKQSVPSFRIMSDRVLTAIAEDQPGTLAELLAIPGIGLKTVEKYGAQIYKILNQARGSYP